MAMQSPFFGKRENETLNSRPMTGSSVSGSNRSGASFERRRNTSTSAPRPMARKAAGPAHSSTVLLFNGGR